jgi:type II secretion system protein N
VKLPALKLPFLKLPASASGATLSPRVRRILALSGYPLFYLFCLFLFAYFTFPYERLRERLLVELEAQRQGNPSSQRVEIESLGPYWFSGVSMKGLSLVSPSRPGAESGASSKLTFDNAHVRVSLLPLLIGRVTISFGAKAFDGTIDGWTRASSDERRIEVSLDDLNMANLSALGDAIGGLPMTGTMNGKLDFVLPEQKLSKATGNVSISITDFTAADGKAKIAGKLALPELKVGNVEIAGEAKDGVLKITKLGAQGKDLDLAGEGRISMRESFSDSLADLNLRFRFSDSYKTKNEMTKSLFGAPGSNMPALFELADPRIRTSKRPDGFYGWHMVGQIKDPRFEPSPAGGMGGPSNGPRMGPMPSPQPPPSPTGN